MNELLQALTAAAKAGFDAPKCGQCSVGRLTARGKECSGRCEPFSHFCGGCPACHATGLDASDPYALIGRADLWLHERACDVLHRWPTNEVIVYWDVPVGALPPRQVARELIERHDGTPVGLAAALLRLVARVGTPQETP